MAKPGDVIEVPDLGVRFEVRETAESTGGEYAEVDVVGHPHGFIKVMHVHAGVTERHEVIEGVVRIKLHGKVHVLRAGDSIDDPARHAPLPAPRGRRHGSRPRPPHAGRADRGVPRGARDDVAREAVQPCRLPEARRGRGVRARPRRVRLRRAAQPPDPEADGERAAQAHRQRVHVRRRVGRPGPGRGRLRRARRRHHLPGVVEAGLHRRHHRRRVHPPALQGSPPVPPAHAHAHDQQRTPAPDRGRDRRRPARHRHLDPHRRTPTAAPTSASTGASTPTAAC